MGKSQVALIAVALLAIAGGVFWYQSRNSQGVLGLVPTPSVSDQKSGSSAVVTEGGNAVNVENQEGGDTIAVDLTVLEEVGFVVIHKATKEGKPGEIVGHSELLPKGQNKDVVVEIDPAASKGDIYFAMLHADTNSDKDFGGTEEDKALTDAQDNAVMAKLTITSDVEAAEE